MTHPALLKRFNDLAAKATPGKWEYREHPRNSDEFFVQAKRLKSTHPYDIEILGDDHGSEQYPTEIRRGDAHLIAGVKDLLTLANVQAAVIESKDADISELVACLREIEQASRAVNEFRKATLYSALEPKIHALLERIGHD